MHVSFSMIVRAARQFYALSLGIVVCIVRTVTCHALPFKKVIAVVSLNSMQYLTDQNL